VPKLELRKEFRMNSVILEESELADSHSIANIL